MPRAKFTQRLAKPFSVMDRNASHSGISQKSDINTSIPDVSAEPSKLPDIISSIVPGSLNAVMLWTDIATAIKTHSTAILVFHLKISIISCLPSFWT